MIGIGNENLDGLVVLRLVRLLRLIKLIRLVRASRMFKRWEAHLSVMYSTVELTKSLVGIFLCGHWCACGWGMPPALLANKGASWLGEFGYCPLNATKYEYCDSAADIYVASLYWSIMTLTSVMRPTIDHIDPQCVCPQRGDAASRAAPSRSTAPRRPPLPSPSSPSPASPAP